MFEFKNKEAEQISNALLTRREYAERNYLAREYQNAVLILAKLFPEDQKALYHDHFTVEEQPAQVRTVKRTFKSAIAAADPVSAGGDCQGCIKTREIAAKIKAAQKQRVLKDAGVQPVEEKTEHEEKLDIAVDSLSSARTVKEVVKYFDQFGDDPAKEMREFLSTVGLESKASRPETLAKKVLQYVSA